MSVIRTCPTAAHGQCQFLLDLSCPGTRDNPYPEYRRYREKDPVHRREFVGPGDTIRYFLTRYADVDACLKDKRLGQRIRASVWGEDLRIIPPEHLDFARAAREWILFMDAPRHSKLRLVFNRILDDGYVQSLRPRMEDIARGMVSELPACGEFDAVACFASLVPTTLNHHLFGLESLNFQDMCRLVQPINATAALPYSHERMTAASASVRSLSEHLSEIISQRRSTGRRPGDVIDRVLQFTDEEPLLMEHQVLPTCLLLLSAAMENTVHIIGNGILTLLRHPDQLSILLARPELLPQTMAEILRYESPVQHVTRHALEEMQIRDQPIEKGAAVFCILSAANRDPEIYTDPDLFDITRPTTRSAGFGLGIHHCPGANLALLQAEVAIAQFFDRFPHLTLVSPHAEWKTLETFRGLKKLSVQQN